MPKVKSQKQWGKLGALMREGRITHGEFDKRVHGVDYSKLPDHVKKHKAQSRAAKLKRRSK